jgi:hypothetical protein
MRVMGLASASFLVYGAAGLGLGGLWGLALGLYVHHARSCRETRGALAGATSPSGAREGGPALLAGVVEQAEEDLPGPVLLVRVPAPPARGLSRWARPFTLALPSGAKVRIEPEHGRWSLDTTFVPVGAVNAGDTPAPLGEETGYAAQVEPGDAVCVSGALHRDNDPRAAGRGYRDAARAWVMRGDLTFSSATVIAAHADRAAFHRRWATALGALGVVFHLLLWSATDPSSSVSSDTGQDGGHPHAPAALAVLAVLGVAVAYWLRAQATTPWLRRTVRVR